MFSVSLPVLTHFLGDFLKIGRNQMVFENDEDKKKKQKGISEKLLNEKYPKESLKRIYYSKKKINFILLKC